MRQLALEFAEALLAPAGIGAGPVFDGLQLGARCNASRAAAAAASASTAPLSLSAGSKLHSPRRPPTAVPSRAPVTTIYVDYVKGDDSSAGTEAAPVKTLLHGLALIRAGRATAQAGGGQLILRGGVHFLNRTITLEAEDSGLSILGHPGDDVMPWISGGCENVLFSFIFRALGRTGGVLHWGRRGNPISALCDAPLYHPIVYADVVQFE